MARQAVAPRIVVAMDFATAKDAMDLIDRLHPNLCRLKVGKEMFTRFGPAFVEKLVTAGYDVFLDLKYHDIPTTVARACAAAADLGVWMVNVHASGGRRMLAAAREALQKVDQPPLLVAVTILTSLDSADLRELGFQGSPAACVERLATVAMDSGLDGVVCSPLEIAALRTSFGSRFLLVTPGIRPADASRADQRRTMTPAEAAHQGASYLVVGRPITQAADPKDALLSIRDEVHRIYGD